jgi:hypothetical protein
MPELHFEGPREIQIKSTCEKAHKLGKQTLQADKYTTTADYAHSRNGLG